MCPQQDPQCGSIAASLEIMGDKWTGQIVLDLTAGPKRFTELEQHLGIGPRTLSQRLDSLEQHAVITKKQSAETPRRMEYSLTPKGEDLLPVLQSMAAWAAKYSS